MSAAQWSTQPVGEPTFTVAMPAYNAAATVVSAIRSVLAQTQGDFELIVVDDGSTDDTAARVREFGTDSRVRLLRQENSGPAAALNAAIAKARGRYISMLDSDDLYMPDYLEVMGRALDADPGAAFAYTDAWVLEDHNRRIRRATVMSNQHPPDPPPADPEQFLAVLVRRNFVYGSITVRRSVIEEIGAYDESLAATQDYDLSVRLAAHGRRGIRPPGLLAVYRVREGSTSKDRARRLANIREICRRVADDYPVSDEIREIARARMGRLDVELAYISGDRRALPLRTRLRRRAGKLKRSALPPHAYYSTTPSEVAAAFPDLENV